MGKKAHCARLAFLIYIFYQKRTSGERKCEISAFWSSNPGFASSTASAAFWRKWRIGKSQECSKTQNHSANLNFAKVCKVDWKSGKSDNFFRQRHFSPIPIIDFFRSHVRWKWQNKRAEEEREFLRIWKEIFAFPPGTKLAPNLCKFELHLKMGFWKSL